MSPVELLTGLVAACVGLALVARAVGIPSAVALVLEQVQRPQRAVIAAAAARAAAAWLGKGFYLRSEFSPARFAWRGFSLPGAEGMRAA